MPVDVRVPALGESLTEGVLARWLKHEGDAVQADEPLLELETDKANVEIPADRAGVLRILKAEGSTVQVGEVVGRIEEGASAAASPPQQASASPGVTPSVSVPPAAATAQSELSPAVRRLVEEHGLDPQAIKASGRGGRLTKGDVLAHLEVTQTTQTPGLGPQASAPSTQASERSTQDAALRTQDSDEERVPMSRLRQRIAERLVQAQHTAAILTTFNEIDMTAVMELRARHKVHFTEVHGVSLGFMSFFARASIAAIRDLPIINAQIDGADVVYRKHVHLGVAVGTERGLVVPVVHNADQLSFAEIEKEIARLAGLARDNKLGIPDLSGGTFTISNGGVYGSLLSTPILNPPQSAILGMHKIEKRPVVVNDQVAIRPMMYLAVSYDHRLIDGEQAVTFLVHVKERLEDPTRLLFEI